MASLKLLACLPLPQTLRPVPKPCIGLYIIHSVLKPSLFLCHLCIRFDLDAFYGEMARILRPQGTLAAWMYDIPRFNVPEADAALHHWYKGVLGKYWSARRVLVDNHYQGTIALPWKVHSTYPP